MTEAPPDPKAERAQRAYEHLRLMELVHGRDASMKWVAISLSDGSCDQRLYTTKAEAIRWQLHETQCAYICLAGVPLLKELRFFLDTCEHLYDQGYAMADPDTYINPEAIL